ncbi:30S ribosomal protein S16 [Actinomyces sp. zg-332]|uniref:30S ribosomal protein S16 n=1 Tax=Actinomyces sp. zg-332 TaxID=2708340 RepID=UPI0014226FC6|nr:30S ribosomal protein S16 [Actinomyces sp. zg-332]QPK93767.1 30S ribosomal protein S16 [Actinomyces sp. zg-332]
MAVRIRLKRMGKIRAPFYRVVVVDSRKKRDGRVIEEVGKYDPMPNPSIIDVNSERVQYWLGVGAQPSDQVRRLLGITGDWAKFKGAKNTEGSLKVKEKVCSATAAEEAVKAVSDEAEKLKAAKAAAEEAAKAEETAQAEEVAEETPAEEPVAEEATPEEEA